MASLDEPEQHSTTTHVYRQHMNNKDIDAYWRTKETKFDTKYALQISTTRQCIIPFKTASQILGNQTKGI